MKVGSSSFIHGGDLNISTGNFINSNNHFSSSGGYFIITSNLSTNFNSVNFHIKSITSNKDSGENLAQTLTYPVGYSGDVLIHREKFNISSGKLTCGVGASNDLFQPKTGCSLSFSGM